MSASMTPAEIIAQAVADYQEWADADGPDVTDADREQCRRFRQAMAELRETTITIHMPAGPTGAEIAAIVDAYRRKRDEMGEGEE